MFSGFVPTHLKPNLEVKTETNLSPSKDGITKVGNIKLEEKGVSGPPEQEVTKRFFTLKTFLSTTTEDWEECWEHTTEPRCFLCNGTFQLNLKTNKTLAIAIALRNYQNERIT